MSEIASRDKTQAAYVVVTAARNEEAHIEKTIRSVVGQTVPPIRWVIVSDASTDRTDAIAEEYAERRTFIQLYRMTADHPRNFAAQVNAINTGFAQLKGVKYDFIGNLDADISFEPTYFEKLLERFEQDPRLGLAGGSICEEDRGGWKPRGGNRVRSVAHAVQLFRRECFDAVGAYLPLPYGGPDWHAEVCSRMNAWSVQSFPDLRVLHHRPTGAAEGRLRSWYRQGSMDFSLGSHPVFEIARLARRLGNRPPVLGALVRLSAFIWAYCHREQRMVSDEFIKFLRREEMEMLWRFVRGKRDLHGAM